jgi:hypothetical protein
MVTNERGEVALKFHVPVPRVAMGTYAFVPRNGLSLAWVPIADAERVKRGCCGGRQKVFEATEEEVRIWQSSG